MSRGGLEVAQVVRRFGSEFSKRFTTTLRSVHWRALKDIAVCRTAELGGHIQRCDNCQHSEIAYNSCRNRHCPKCQAGKRAKWLQDREAELLPVPYFHVVFTLPSQFNQLALQNPKLIYGLLFKAASRTLLEVAQTPKHLGARLGFLCVLHTWGSNLMLHPHLHCVVPAGGLANDKSKWIHARSSKSEKPFFLPVRVLSRVFRGKFINGLKSLFNQGKLQLHGRLKELREREQFEALLNKATRKDWVVYAKRPFGGPTQVLKYLARYTHRVAISNQRLLSVNQSSVTFQYKDYANQSASKRMRLSGVEFLCRFCMHILPSGFMRIRHYGWMANRNRKQNVSRCRRLLGQSILVQQPEHVIVADAIENDSNSATCPICREGSIRRIDVPVIRKFCRAMRVSIVRPIHAAIQQPPRIDTS